MWKGDPTIGRTKNRKKTKIFSVIMIIAVKIPTCISNLAGEKSPTLSTASKAIAIKNNKKCSSSKPTSSFMKAHQAISYSTFQWTSLCSRKIISSVWIKRVSRRLCVIWKKTRMRVAQEPENATKIKVRAKGHLQPLCKRLRNTHRRVLKSSSRMILKTVITVLMYSQSIAPSSAIEDRGKPSSCSTNDTKRLKTPQWCSRPLQLPCFLTPSNQISNSHRKPTYWWKFTSNHLPKSPQNPPHKTEIWTNAALTSALHWDNQKTCSKPLKQLEWLQVTKLMALIAVFWCFATVANSSMMGVWPIISVRLQLTINFIKVITVTQSKQVAMKVASLNRKVPGANGAF